MAKRGTGRAAGGGARRPGSRRRDALVAVLALLAGLGALWLIARPAPDVATDEHGIDAASRAKLLEVLREEDP